ncbi:MAG TPA: ferrochelatase [Ktedonobacterales bacterium]
MTISPALSHVGVVLMTYGSPPTLHDVPAYLRNVYGGREPSEEVVTEFKRRYQLIGGSPLLRITQEQAAAVEAELNQRHPNGPVFTVAAGMRFFAPFVADVVPQVARDADALVGVIMSPQYSPILMRGYITALREAAATLGRDDLLVAVTEDWHMQPEFLQAVADRVREALDAIPEERRDQTPALLSAHSMPLRVVATEPDYIDNLKQTAAAIAERAGLGDSRWQFCYQSAGHTPEEWLKPDFADLMPHLAARGVRDVLIAPVQFLADHLEILYDIEVGARKQAEEHGITFHRTASLNTAPLFIRALASVVESTLTRAAPLAPASAGR